jgi:hypothetical protein
MFFWLFPVVFIGVMVVGLGGVFAAFHVHDTLHTLKRRRQRDAARARVHGRLHGE